jgi:mRNA-degrading endonuclease toxin of MazEF toxin-antitoxin module
LIDTGDIYLADRNDERRSRVLVISSDRFHRASSRALVAPEILGGPDEVPFPWRVQIEGQVCAVDLIRSLPVDRLLDRVDRASAAKMAEGRRALLNIT